MTRFPPPVTVRELFPADDLVARWVFSLSAVLEDLALTESQFADVLRSDRGALWTGYHYRQLIARLYEAERPIIAVKRHHEVREFLAGIPDAQAPLAFLIEYYVPADGTSASKVRETYGGVRHRTVHHSWPASDELRQALEDAGDAEARILVNRREEWLHHEWPEAVALRSMLGDLDEPAVKAEFVDRVELAQAILRQFVLLLKAVLVPHVERVGVDPGRLVDEVG
jgi:hypothetical protein